MGRHRGGGIRGERKEAGWRTRWRQLRRGPSLSYGGIDGQMGRVWRAVASASSDGPTRHDYIFYFIKNRIYICTIYIQY
jgi:hypothetical protein